MHTGQKGENIKPSIDYDSRFLGDSDSQLVFMCKWRNTYLRLMKLCTGPTLDIYVTLKQRREDRTLKFRNLKVK